MVEFTRRKVMTVASGAALALAAMKSAAARPMPTPRQTEGPFYPDVMPDDVDNDLVKIAGRARMAGGEILALTGRVLDAEGRPQPQALVEIWQCDVEGNYIHTEGGAARKRDANFQGYGRTRTDAEGRYTFRTIKPAPYPGRTPHIHMKVTAAGGRALTTQMYVEGEPRNARDFLYRALSADEKARVTAKLERASGPFDWTGAFDIVLS
ncbi:MAG: protocatechuate 3,4-dioxygenase [Hyphomicrobiales bacterium]|nr:protocatechuate 3,4-dioxygenase [Hyphomicrobiales bacterium]